MKTAKLLKSIKPSTPITLQTVISMDNHHQAEEGFIAFVEMVNRHNDTHTKITHVEVILSDFLQRHYFGEQHALKMGDRWIETNLLSIEGKLKSATFTLTRWSSFLNKEEFTTAIQKIATLYKENKDYREIVDNLSQAYVKKGKGNMESAKNYLFEECAVACLLKGYLAYPSAELNPGLSYVVSHLNPELIYLGYMVYPAKKNTPKSKLTEGTSGFFSRKDTFNQSGEPKRLIESTNPKSLTPPNGELLTSCLVFTEILEKHGISATKQTEFFSAFVRLKNEFTFQKDDQLTSPLAKQLN